MADEPRGVLKRHFHRMENDQHYRDLVLTPPSTKRHHNSEDHRDNTGGAAAKGDENTHKKTKA